MRTGLITRLVGLFVLTGLGVQAQQEPETRGEKYALLVGVRAYDPNELRSLPYSEADAEGLAEIFLANGYKPRNVVLMTQKAGAEKPRFLPTADRIRKELALLVEDTMPSDSIVVGLAGHGVQFRDNQESYFCPADARLDDKSSLIPLSEIYKALEQCPAGLKLLLVDACRNDPQSDNSRARSVVTLESTTRPQAVEPPGGVVALFSCSAGQKAYEHADLKHGVFFNYVIEGLKGAATGAQSSEVTLPELELFVMREVRDFVRAEYGVKQVPERVGRNRGLIPLVTLDRTSMGFKQALALAEAGEIDKALAMQTEVLQANPDMAVAYLERGILRAKKGDFIAAVDDYNSAITHKLVESRVYIERARAYYQTNQYDWAIADCNEVLRLEPKHSNAYNLRALCHDDKGDEDRAITDYNEALRLDPTSAMIFTNRGSSYQDKGDLDHAIADCTEAIRLDPNLAFAYRTRASCLFKKGQHLPSINDYTEAIRLEPNNSSTYNLRALVYDDQGDEDRAIADYTEALRLNPSSATIFSNRGSSYQDKGDLDHAIADCTEALRLDPKQAFAYRTRASCLFDKKEYFRCIVDYTEALKFNPKDTSSLNGRGAAYSFLNHFDEAYDDYTEAIRHYPQFARAYLNRSKVVTLRGQDRSAQAAADRAKALSIDPKLE